MLKILGFAPALHQMLAAAAFPGQLDTLTVRQVLIVSDGDPDRVIGHLLCFRLKFGGSLRSRPKVLSCQCLLAGQVGSPSLIKESRGSFVLGCGDGKDLLNGSGGFLELALRGQLLGVPGQLRQRARGSV